MNWLITESTQLNDTTIEERVSVLEFQMSNVLEDITTINTDIIIINDDITNVNTDVDTLEDEVTDLDEDVESQLTIISAEQVLQDERLLAIEENDQGYRFIYLIFSQSLKFLFITLYGYNNYQSVFNQGDEDNMFTFVV